MPRYLVTLVVTGDIEVEVHADNPDFARDMADDKIPLRVYEALATLTRYDFVDSYVEEIPSKDGGNDAG